MAKDSGWVKIHRKIQDNDNYFCEPFCRNMAWIDMILLANHEKKSLRVRGIMVDLHRGQIGFSQDKLAERWQWSRGKVIRFLDELQKSGMIVRQKNNVLSCISIINYKKYQDSSTADSTTSKTTGSTTSGTTDSTLTRTIKNYIRTIKKHKEGENDFFAVCSEDLFIEVMKYILPEMMKYFIEKNSWHVLDEHKDYSACLKISFKIADSKSWKRQTILNGNMESCLKEWITILNFCRTADFFSELTPEGIETNFSKIIQKIKSDGERDNQRTMGKSSTNFKPFTVDSSKPEEPL